MSPRVTFSPLSDSGFVPAQQLPPHKQPSAGEPLSNTVLRQIQSQLGALTTEQLDRIFSLAEDLREEDGAYQEQSPAALQERASGGFDLMPVILDGATWLQIETGLIQRVRAWNAFLSDIYSDQQILKAELVPFELVYSDPNFHRGCSYLAAELTKYLQFTAFDLQQDSKGQWWVLEDYLGSAEGASYALKKRQIFRQVAGRLFEGLELLPVEDFAAQLLDILQERFDPSNGRPQGVLLSKGSGDRHYLDHAALARQMGLPIVQGSDLVVLDNRLYLKTIAGVERVDIVLRRLPTSQLDPVTFDSSSRCGVPGLLACVRRGTVTVSNGMGSDLANNRALTTYLPRMIEFYLNEKAVLQSPPQMEMHDLDVREEVADKRHLYQILHVWNREPDQDWNPNQMQPLDWKKLWEKIEANPRQYIARKLIQPAAHPCWTENGARTATITLRAFALGLDRISPCALAWVGSPSSLTASVVQTTDRIKDVWILRSASAVSAPQQAQAEEEPKRLRLTSRVAESLFWMGRYAERAEATTRLLRVTQIQAWPGGNSPQAQQRQPIWSALAVVTGNLPDFFTRPIRQTPFAAQVPHYFLLDRQHPGSVISCLRSCRNNAENIREQLPPEVWAVLNRLYVQQALAADQSQTEEVKNSLENRQLHSEIITQLDELTGALEKHMVHNDAWHFWQLGVFAERSIITLQAMQQVITHQSSSGRPGTNVNLDLLLQTLAAQYAYRSLYHARPVAARVTRLLLQDDDFPRSAMFCLHRMCRVLERTLGERLARGADEPLRHCQRLVTDINFLDMSTYFPPEDETIFGDDNLSELPIPQFTGKLADLIEQLLEFNVLISDHYLDHQVFLREPDLFERP